MISLRKKVREFLFTAMQDKVELGLSAHLTCFTLELQAAQNMLSNCSKSKDSVQVH